MCPHFPSIVATRVDGATDVVEDGVNGFLLPPHECEGIAEKVIYLFENPDKAKEMGERGKEKVKEFDCYKMVREQEELYSDLLLT
jgi:hypothetical protein